ncbi:MAG: hypothetical protein IT531_01800 [Burkholderiales bacterium]|nr:hypothetical protein [Burkholderiales bacterium]
MVQFVRDVIILVAILTSLMAFAFYPGQDADPVQRHETQDRRMGLSTATTVDPATTSAPVAPAPR